MFFRIVGTMVLLGLIAIGFYYLRQSRLRYCPHCRRRNVHSLTHRTIKEDDLSRESFEFLKIREEDVVSGPAGTDQMVVLVRPMQTIFRPCWLFGEFHALPVAGTVVDSIETATCSECEYQSVNVISRIDDEHPDRVAIRERIAQLQCPDCSTHLVWLADDDPDPVDSGFTATCPACGIELAIDDNYSLNLS